jgi:hypothetical protein
MRLSALLTARSSGVIWYCLCCSTLLSAAPTINRITPTLGRPGDIVTVTGSGFSLDPSQIDARFGPNRAPVLNSTGTALTLQVPNGQPYAPTQVSVDGSNSLLFNTASNTKPGPTYI